MQDSTIRLDKFLANNGYASRRGVKYFLKTENVTVNGKRMRESGFRIDLENDDIRINLKKIKNTKHVYYVLNKPKGIISTSSDEFDRENVTNLVPNDIRVYPVGRLDKDTHGLILLTNDGDLTHKLTHPKFHVSKKYILEITGSVSDAKIEKLKNGIILSDGITAPAKARKVKENESSTIIEMEIFEGRYRQIRRMCDAIFLPLTDLKRIQFGPIRIEKLKEGNFRELTSEEVELLKRATL
jgi:23S rRNA pseudouridine2605 synthase